MRADNDIDRAVCHAFQCGFGGFAVVETRKAGDFHGEIGETVGEVLRVLLDQKRGWGEYGNLFAAHHRHKRGTQRDFGFAETDIATHETVHRLRLRQIFNLGGGVARFFGGFALRLVPRTTAELV